MKIRDATTTDAADIAAFWNPQISDTIVTFNAVEKSVADVSRMIHDRPCFLVLETEDSVAGFVTYDQFRSGVGYQHTMEHTIILAPHAQGQGEGRALMLAAMEHARARQVHSLVAGVSGENAAGVAFHLALGFEQIAVLPQVGRKFDRWMGLVLLQKRL
jgi:phosphinothricin acetyltransferase